jgi:hypothetical protein
VRSCVVPCGGVCRGVVCGKAVLWWRWWEWPMEVGGSRVFIHAACVWVVMAVAVGGVGMQRRQWRSAGG